MINKMGNDNTLIKSNDGLVKFFPKLYKFRTLTTEEDLKRIKDIIDEGFYCSDILKFNDMNEGVYHRNTDNKSVTLEEKMNYKICSFSEKSALYSELMWGHYADAGKGIVIEVVSLEEDIKSLKEVKYSDNKSGLKTIEDILTNKSTVWSYEKEWRYLKKTDENPIKIGKITKIYFGTPYKILDNYNDIKRRHKNLQDYHSLRESLKEYCGAHHPSIECVDWSFSKKAPPDIHSKDFFTKTR